MEGPCPACNRKHDQALHNGLCYYHSKQVKSGAKATEPVNKKSIKQAAQDRAFAVMAAAHKKAFPYCQAKLEGCGIKTTQTHHKGGRGKNLLVWELLLSICDSCHDKVTTDSAMAIRLGLSVSRLSKETTDNES